MGQTNIIITGVGGQGIITAGLLIGNAVTASGLNAIMSEIHGMSQRGGGVTVELRIGDVHGPITPRGDVNLILGFEALETLRVVNRASVGATVIMNKEEIVPVTVNVGDAKYPEVERAVSKLRERGVKLYVMDARRLAAEAGNRLSSNVVLVGAAYAAGFIPVELSFLQESLKKMFPERSWSTNLKALELGMQQLALLRDEFSGKPRLSTLPSSG
jgi:indolepyruvate ferredoxin oxidoreductase beta subunit